MTEPAGDAAERRLREPVPWIEPAAARRHEFRPGGPPEGPSRSLRGALTSTSSADAFTYGFPDPAQAFTHAQLVLDGGLDTPRVHAILASSYLAFGNVAAAAAHLERHLDLVTTDLVSGAPLVTRDSIDVALVPGRTVEIPVPAIAGENVSITTTSNDYWDSIAVLLAPDGTPGRSIACA